MSRYILAYMTLVVEYRILRTPPSGGFIGLVSEKSVKKLGPS